ncbi:hypothetical protein [uncultured Pseudodesulfovibrio sp.]|uniref:hypothetical protein n=1 Tax=uncultured Pseudodesulfovibrio sp. TaxID=2035858 RepID=UPI0029C6DE30|nr:hypothetical protein [uncultured Pseudodesulfovibrio sp.]
MRIQSHASQEYRRQSTLAEKPREKKSTQAQARMTTTSFGFRLGKFGVDFQSRKTVIDPSLSRDVRERNRQADAFKTESEVESLRAKIGREGADFRSRQVGASSAESERKPSFQRVRTAMAAYARSTEEILPPPGNMLASVV